MRLTCPNCRAQYEVDDSVIPEGGRDVQCSACGHTWFQNPVETRLPAAPAESPGPDDDEEDAGGAAVTAATTTTAPRIDRSVLDVLREEAERELRQRRRGEAPLETQGDLGLVSRPHVPSRPVAEPETASAPARPAPRDARPTAAPDETAGAAGAERPASRRHLLPDIEELSSTLEPGREPRRKPGEVAPDLEPDRRGGFRAGLSVVVLLVLFLGAIYLFAGPIGRAAPVLAEPLAGYVALVDGLRAAVSETLRGLVGRMGATG